MFNSLPSQIHSRECAVQNYETSSGNFLKTQILRLPPRLFTYLVVYFFTYLLIQFFTYLVIFEDPNSSTAAKVARIVSQTTCLVIFKFRKQLLNILNQFVLNFQCCTQIKRKFNSRICQHRFLKYLRKRNITFHMPRNSFTMWFAQLLC